MVVIKCWATEKGSSELLGMQLFVASSLEEAQKVAKEWESKEDEYLQYHAQILTLSGNRLV